MHMYIHIYIYIYKSWLVRSPSGETPVDGSVRSRGPPLAATMRPRGVAAAGAAAALALGGLM